MNVLRYLMELDRNRTWNLRIGLSDDLIIDHIYIQLLIHINKYIHSDHTSFLCMRDGLKGWKDRAVFIQVMSLVLSWRVVIIRL